MYNGAELVVNAETFAGAKEKDIMEIYWNDKPHRKLYLNVSAKVNNIKPHLSVSNRILKLFGLVELRGEVKARVLSDPSEAELEFVTLSFKDQWLGASDMWQMKCLLEGTCLHINKQVTISSATVPVQVKELINGKNRYFSGLITPRTKFLFRSRSTNITLFFQMSKEMWDYGPDGQLYFEKAVNDFLPTLFQKWKSLGTNHLVTIIFTSRTYYPQGYQDSQVTFQIDHKGRPYQDVYYLVAENVRSDFPSLIVELKRKFLLYPSVINWNSPNNDSGKNPIGQNSTSADGNFLESIYLGLTLLCRDYLDCDLTTTGDQIIVLSAGPGIFDVDYNLEGIVKKTIEELGVAVDLVCLTKHPLYLVPLFHFVSHGESKNTNHLTPDKTIGKYAIAQWVYIFFYDSVESSEFTDPGNENEIETQVEGFNMSGVTLGLVPPLPDISTYSPSCTIPSFQSVNVHTQKTILPSSKYILPKKSSQSTDIPSSHFQFANHDESVFAAQRNEPYKSTSKQTAKHSQDMNQLSKKNTSPKKKKKKKNYYNDLELEYPEGTFGEQTEMPFDTSDEESIENSPRLQGSQLKLSSSPPTKEIPQTDVTSIPHDILSLPYTSTPTPPLNPFKPSSYTDSVKPSNYLRSRWAHLLRCNQENIEIIPVGSLHWRSLCEPACLPLTTSYFPPEDKIRRCHKEFSQTLNLADYPYIYKESQQLVKELILQRLAQGYQLCVGTSYEQDASTTCMSIGRYYDVITEDNGRITIKSLRKYKGSSNTSYTYQYALWTPYSSHYLPMSLSVHYEPRNSEEWTHLYQVLCGSEYRFDHFLKYWRKSFLLIPTIEIEEDYRSYAPTTPSGRVLSSSEINFNFTKFIDFIKAKIDTNPTNLPAYLKEMTVSHELTVRSEVSSEGSPNEFDVRKSQERPKTKEPENSKTSNCVRLTLRRPAGPGGAQSSSRYEWINLLYDDAFSPLIGYRLELRWIVGEGTAVCEFVQTLMRKAKALNFSLLQVPNEQDMTHPLRSSFFVSFPESFVSSLSGHRWPVVVSTIQKHLCSKLNYFLLREPRKYIHKTGSLFVTIQQSGFDLTVNWLMGNNQNQLVVSEFRNFVSSLTTLDALCCSNISLQNSQEFDLKSSDNGQQQQPPQQTQQLIPQQPQSLPLHTQPQQAPEQTDLPRKRDSVPATINN
eukprot:TRINITY_DN9625_c0_g1_i1.p1 TRINITY_DN9625_c0_g1~~TRINITY_DN9625_c0_g1_i1.p1  ORF type:complete len:1189 (-),score=301.58 TRINITY_DN9625_c0_g1_i1:69-3581(-)